MAFDRPIEADQIGDFNIFSAFVRAPLWILGGVLGNSSWNDGEEPSVVHRLDDSSPSSFKKCSRTRAISDDDICTGQENNGSVNWRDSSPDRFGGSIVGKGPPGLRRSKNLSWSDESGKSLVEYNDESVLHEPTSYSSLTSNTASKPPKSALRRSRSIRSEFQTKEEMRYIPRMTAAQHGLIIPTKPFGTNAANTGIESPQLGYGFYMNLTPPTPEIYHSHVSNAAQSQITSVSSSAAMQAATRPHPNHVFQNLQSNKAPMGWSSVPL